MCGGEALLPLSDRFSAPYQHFQDLPGSIGDTGTRAEDAGHALVVEKLVILRRNDAPYHHEDIVAAEFFQFFNGLRHEGFMAGCQGGDSEDVDVVFGGLAGGFGWRLEKRADVVMRDRDRRSWWR